MPQMPFSISSTSAEPAGPSVAAGGINWEDFNHPPLLRLWHFAPRELEPNARRVARVAHAAYWLLLTSLLVNLPASIGLAAAGVEGAPLNIMYSVFNVLIGGGVGIWAEMSLYKGVGKNLPSLMARYLAIWGVFTLAMLAFSVMPIANFNGWLRLRLVHDDATLSDGARARSPRHAHPPARPPAALSTPARRRADVRTFWTIMTVVESILWTLSFVVSCYTWSLVYRVQRDGPAALGVRVRPGRDRV